MSDPVLPPEILDYVLDLLHDDPESLKQCCLVATSWVPRTRRYLFAHINFYAARFLESWSNTFPDPTNSPAPHVRTLEIDCYPGDLEGADWIRTFSCVVKLTLDGYPTLPFVLFHGFSHNLKSLEILFIKISCSDLFKFICSFPLLENLDLVSETVLDDAKDFHELQPSLPLPLTGSLRLIVLHEEMQGIVRYLLNLPSGLHFRELVLLLVVEDDLRWLNELVLRCSNTLELLDIKYIYSASSNSIDLSQVKKLKVLKVRLRHLWPERIIAMLETITAEHRDLRQISIYLPFEPIPRGNASQCRTYFGDDLYEKWLRLDRLLIQFWELHLIRTKVVVTESMWGNQNLKARIGSFFPEMTARGIVDLTEEY